MGYAAFRMMRIALIAVTLGLLFGCSTTEKQPEYKKQDMVVDKYVQPMSRNEVIVAVRECEANGLRAVVLYGKRKINGFTTDIVVEVTCAPKF